MLSKFLSGAASGFGFAIAILVTLLVSCLFLDPCVGVRSIACWHCQSSSVRADLDVGKGIVDSPDGATPFRNIGLEGKIARSSAIAISEYRKDAHGQVQSVIVRFCKQLHGGELRYSVGDVFPPSGAFPDGYVRRGDGFIVFFVGVPPMVELATAYSKKRVELGVTLDDFQRMCEESPEERER